MPTEPLAQRKIGRVDRAMPPALWRIESPSALIEACIDAGADWFFIPMTVSDDALALLAPALAKAHIVIGIAAEQFAMRSTKKVDDRLAAIGRATVDAVMLQQVSLAEVKEGRTFHRYNQLRDQKRVELCFVGAETHADAEWLVRHTPAHGVSMIFGLGDPTARYRVLTEAAEIGTAVLARRASSSVWEPSLEMSRSMDLSFIAGHSQVTSVIEPLPQTIEDLQAVLRAIQHPMTASDSDAAWKSFGEQVPEPKKLRGAHPPEWA